MNTINQYETLKINYDALEREAAHYKNLFKKSNSEFSREIAENVATKLDLKNKNDLLVERIKELNCLNEISRCDDEDLNLDMFITKVVNIVASAFRYPEDVSVEIKYNDRFWHSENFVRTRLRLDHVLSSQKNIIGEISIFYNDKIAEIKTSPFLNEEKQLLATIAYSLGQIIHRSETDNRLKMLQTAINQSPLMISFTNLKTKKLEFVNPMFYKMFGLERGDILKDELYYNTPDSEISHDEREREEHISNRVIWRKTFQNVTNDGASFWQKTALYPFVENSIVTHTLGISEDISNEISDAEELRQAKENYEHIAQNVPEAIFIIGSDGSQLYANKMASKVTGYTNAEILKLNLSDLIHPDDYDKVKSRFVTRLSGRILEPRYETRLKTKDGETKCLEVSGSKTKWMGEVVILVVVNDITEKRRFENLLKIQDEIDYCSSIPDGLNASLKKIFDSLLEFDWIDGGGVYLNFDEGLKLVFHRGLSDRFVNKRKFSPLGSAKYSLVMSAKNQYFMFDSRQYDSSHFIEEGICSFLVIPLTHDNEVIGTLNLATKNQMELSENEKIIFESIATSISQMIALINAQEALKGKNKELQHTIQKVQEKQQLLVQKSKLESLGEMAAGVAHEINQPLGIIFLSLENILFKISEKKMSQEYLDKKLNSITDNIKKIKEIIDHIRTFSRDQKSIILERVDINKVIKKVFSMVSEQYTYHNIIINSDLKADIGFTLGNSHKLEQVLYNLFSNAKFALEEKEVSPGVGTFEKKIHIKTYCNENKLFIEVKDNGIGIEKENLDNIFNPFFTTKPEGKGTGLGLSIVYGIITEMKGSINIVSVRDEYTTVSIELPRTQ